MRYHSIPCARGPLCVVVSRIKGYRHSSLRSVCLNPLSYINENASHYVRCILINKLYKNAISR